MSEARIVEFNALPEVTRKRLLACIGQVAEPKPLYVNEAPRVDEGAKGLAAAIAGVVAFAYLIIAGLGERIDQEIAVVYIAAGVAVVAGLMVMLRTKAQRKRLPYVEGAYLFPLDLVYIKGGQLLIIPLVGLTGINLFANQTGYIEMRMRFGGATHSLLIDGKQRAERLAAQLQAERERFAAALAANDLRVFAPLDVFYDARVSGEWDRISTQRNVPAAGSPSVGKAPLWTKRPVLLGGIVGVALGAGTLLARNMVSDDMMFAKAKDAMTVAALHGYLENGGTRHADEVHAVLLPRADLDETKRKGSVTSLRQYRERYPGGPHDEEAREAIHALFLEAIEKFEGEAKRADPKVREHMRALFAWLEAHDSPPVEIRFRAPDPEVLEEVDTLLAGAASEAEVKRIVPISPSFSADRTTERETWIFQQLAGAFAQAVPADILDLQFGAALPLDADVAKLEPERATISVSYLIDASGSVYANDDRINGYIGIAVGFVVTILIPADEGQASPRPLSLVLSVEPPSEFEVRTDGIQIAITDQLVYDVMAKKAFEALDTQLRAALFEADTDELRVFVGEVPKLSREEFLFENDEEEAPTEP